MSTQKSYSLPFAIITVLFFLWGFITVLVDSLIPRLREIFELTYFQAGAVQFAFFIAYFLFSIPAGFVLGRIGYQRGIVLGLITMALGCLLFWPAASLRNFPIFLFGYFTLAAGITFLQVAANPYVAALGSEQSASSRLNLSQAFNSLGTALAPIFGALFLLSDTIKSSHDLGNLEASALEAYYIAEASAVQKPFVAIAVTIGLLVLIFSLVKLPVLISGTSNKGYRELLQHKGVLMGSLGIFVYVGAEVAIGSYLVNYFIDMNMPTLIMEHSFTRWMVDTALGKSQTPDAKAIVGVFVAFYWLNAMLGRFIGAYLTQKFPPAKVLASFALLAIAMLALSMGSVGFVAMFSILGVGLFNSIMFPTLFTLTLEGLGPLKPQASGILVTAVVGGAIIPPLYGLLTDYVGFKTAFLLLIACYAYILFFARSSFKLKQSV